MFLSHDSLSAVLSGAIASLINFAMWLLPLEHGLFLVFSCVSSAVMMVTINSLGVMATNLYPTSIRWVVQSVGGKEWGGGETLIGKGRNK